MGMISWAVHKETSGTCIWNRELPEAIILKQDDLAH